jgi:hypothetical protein
MRKDGNFKPGQSARGDPHIASRRRRRRRPTRPAGHIFPPGSQLREMKMLWGAPKPGEDEDNHAGTS